MVPCMQQNRIFVTYFLFRSTKSNLDEKKYIQNELCKYDYVSLSLKKFHVCLIELFWNLLVDVKFFRNLKLYTSKCRKLDLKSFFHVTFAENLRQINFKNNFNNFGQQSGKFLNFHTVFPHCSRVFWAELMQMVKCSIFHTL